MDTVPSFYPTLELEKIRVLLSLAPDHLDVARRRDIPPADRYNAACVGAVQAARAFVAHVGAPIDHTDPSQVLRCLFTLLPESREAGRKYPWGAGKSPPAAPGADPWDSHDVADQVLLWSEYLIATVLAWFKLNAPTAIPGHTYQRVGHA